MTVREFLIALARRWRGVVALFLIVVAGAAVATWRTPPVFESRTTVYFAATDAQGKSTGNLYQMPAGEKSTLTRIARSRLVLDPVRQALGYDASVPANIAATTSGGEDAALFDFVVRSDTPAHAHAFAQQVPVELARSARSYAPTLAQSGADVQAQFVDEPTMSSTPVSPDPVRNLVLAGLAGLMLGLAYALGMNSLDTRLRTIADVRAISDTPVLSAIPALTSAKADGLYVLDDPFGPQSEAVRKLRTNLVFVDVAANSGHSFVVTSALPAEGKTTTVINLALAMAESGRRVLLIDADLRRPSVAQELGLEGAVGLTTILAGAADPEDVIQRWGNTGMHVLAVGDIPPNPSELLGSKAMENLFYKLARDFEFVLVDSPPVLPVTDALVMARLTRGVLMVVSTATRRRHLAEALRTLETGEVAADGFVLTKTATERNSSYYYYYGQQDRGRRARKGLNRKRAYRAKAVRGKTSVTRARVR